MIKERLQLLRAEMAKESIDAYIIPTSDFHQSEYVGNYFKTREFMSGFTGSAGILVVTANEAGLWTDGRYFLQAEDQLSGSSITLYRMGEENVPTITEYLKANFPANGKLGFDGRVIDYQFGMSMTDALADKNITVSFSKDLVDSFWTDRPALSAEPAFLLSTDQTGESTSQKLSRIREQMSLQGASALVVASLDDICWTLNIRGNDVACNPVVLSYLIIKKDTAVLFVNEAVLSDPIRTALANDGVELRPYNDIYSYVAAFGTDETVLADELKINYSLIKSIPEGVKIVFAQNPQIAMKAVKNETELKNLRNCHIRDGVAVTKFTHWLVKNIGKAEITELSASNYLEALRAEQEGFIEPSFDTISGFAHHGAIIHYEPTPETDIPLEPRSFLLVDSGGQYTDGTTDITRTIALGELTDEEKLGYTIVLKGALNLASIRFPYGCCGANLDILARKPFWEHGLDYKHGTGHGVGFLLNVHEGPQSFHFNKARTSSLTRLEEGMVTTDEPGVYIEGKYGVRIENELVCRKDIKNEYGQFMSFENITCAPIDLTGVLTDLLTEDEKKHLNSYHAWVRETLRPFLTEEENTWLEEYTKAI